MTWNPTTSHWPSHLIWLRTTHSADCWQRSALHTQVVQGNNNWINTCVGDDTKAVTHQTQNYIKKQKNKIRQKRLLIWRMEFFHPAMWHVVWDDMLLNSPKRPPYWNSASGFDFDHITAVDLSFCTSLRNFIQIGPPSSRKTDCVMSIFKMADLRHLEF